MKTFQPYRFFIAGIIQGSKRDLDVHDQDYRPVIRSVLEEKMPGCEVYCPVEHHPDSVHYDEAKARDVFLDHIERVRTSQALIVYLPEASMGSAVEMWEAHHAGTLVFTISPMTTNWVVRILSDRIYRDVQDFVSFVDSGEMERILSERIERVQEEGVSR